MSDWGERLRERLSKLRHGERLPGWEHEEASDGLLSAEARERIEQVERERDERDERDE